MFSFKLKPTTYTYPSSPTYIKNINNTSVFEPNTTTTTQPSFKSGLWGGMIARASGVNNCSSCSGSK